MAPVYDTGNCLFYNEDPVPVKSGLLNVKVNSFCKKETDMLSYIPQTIEPLKFDVHEYSEYLYMMKLYEAIDLLKQYTKMPEERAEKIAETVQKKIEYLQLFQEGKKIWKREKYW